MFPTSFIETNTETGDDEDTGVDFYFNYETGQHEISGSKITMCDSLESVRQYVQNILRTPADEYKVYTKNEDSVFGLSVYKYIGERTLPIGYLNSELKREVTELCLLHPLIADVTDWVGIREKRGLNISFTVTLTDDSLINISQTITGMPSYYLGISSSNSSGADSTGCSCVEPCTCSSNSGKNKYTVYKGEVLEIADSAGNVGKEFETAVGFKTIGEVFEIISGDAIEIESGEE